MSEVRTDTKPPVASSRDDRGFFSELIRFTLIALAIVLPIRLFIAQPFIVSGSSMDPTFTNGDYLIVDQISYRFEEPHRGDVIIFHFPLDPSKFFIKRIIGLPGETVRIADETITIVNEENPEGMPLTEPYISAPVDTVLSRTLGDTEYFVMGDNRPASSDSRSWGALERDLIAGRALVRLLPVTDIDLFPGKHMFETVISDITRQ